MKLKFKKQPLKYLASVDTQIRNKLFKALDKLKEIEGDIKKLKGTENFFRFKIAHYRILFSIDRDGQIIIVETIDTRTHVKY